jgi:integrase/recombinase XerD
MGGVPMKLTEVIDQFLMDVHARGRAEHTTISYNQRLRGLVWLLQNVCTEDGNSIEVTELERVKVLYLRQSVQYLLTSDKPLPSSDPKYAGHNSASGKVLDASTVGAYVRVWKAFFNWCYQEELIDVNPAARLRSPKVTKRIVQTFSVEHLKVMLAVCDLHTEKGFRDYVIVLLFLDTGIRLTELARLRVSDVHDVYVKVAFGKGRRDREVGVSPEVGRLLWKYIHKYRKPGDDEDTPLFNLTPAGVKMVINRIKAASGIDGVRVSPHTFRHTFAKMYLELGGDLFKLSREMGHSDVKITKAYLENFHSTEARKDHTAFSPVSMLDLQKKKRRKQSSE